MAFQIVCLALVSALPAGSAIGTETLQPDDSSGPLRRVFPECYSQYFFLTSPRREKQRPSALIDLEGSRIIATPQSDSEVTDFVSD